MTHYYLSIPVSKRGEEKMSCFVIGSANSLEVPIVMDLQMNAAVRVCSASHITCRQDAGILTGDRRHIVRVSCMEISHGRHFSINHSSETDNIP